MIVCLQTIKYGIHENVLLSKFYYVKQTQYFEYKRKFNIDYFAHVVLLLRNQIDTA